jgi:uncharacterized protein DUF4242
MPAYLVELYVPSASPGQLEASRRARASAKAMAREGRHVRYVSSLFVPEDEICFLLFEAASRDLVGEVSRRAELAYERIVEAIH